MKTAILLLAYTSILLSVCGIAYHFANRETCPKSGGVCDCRYCQCEPGCPGVCHAEKCK